MTNGRRAVQCSENVDTWKSFASNKILFQAFHSIGCAFNEAGKAFRITLKSIHEYSQSDWKTISPLESFEYFHSNTFADKYLMANTASGS